MQQHQYSNNKYDREGYYRQKKTDSKAIGVLAMRKARI